MNITTNTFIEKIKINDNHYDYISLKKISRRFDFDLLKLPFTYRILLENLVRCSEDDESLKRFAYGYAKIIRADRQEPEENKSNSMPQKTQDEGAFELKSSTEYDICNAINSIEVNHRDRDFDVFGYMEKKI